MDTETYTTSFGFRLRNARKLCNLTQEDLSKKTKLSVSSIGSYENNRTYPHQRALGALSEALGMSVQYLIYGSRQPDLDFNNTQEPFKNKLMNTIVKDLIFKREKILASKKKLELELSKINLNLEENEANILDAVLKVLK